ncbi:hypothetical protein [Erwinia sp. E_sp_B01_9]
MTQTASYGAILPVLGMMIFIVALLKEVADRKDTDVGSTDLI